MASALLSALAPAAIGALTGGGKSSGGNVLGDLVQEGVKKSGGIMSGVGGFVSDLLHGKGFKESLAGGIDTMIGRKPQETSASTFEQRADKGGVFYDSQGNHVTKISEAAPGLKGIGVSMTGSSMGTTTTPNGLRDFYITAVIPMPVFNQMVMLYMAQKGFSEQQKEYVRKEFSAIDTDFPAGSAPSQSVPTKADQNRAVEQMYRGTQQQQYGFPILAPANVNNRSSEFLFPKYAPNPRIEQQTPPSVQPPTQLPKGMPVGGISTSGGAVATIPGR